ncbi:nose resistant to fluoxetine protein 6 [Drosophila guanche]|uniref:Blast:Nose resistant to fluoxetine protein 6 n=1 Tax=Drosophila guanche TaxID=7266 RepID=A0A3B0JN12_DROGU|nr:nose resistant to fluoxetine protein 6 [Drosophila guanche]SPP83614.1 blast:Nose resistant to fluoxetine protein 6 [Drosophila guanche]
MLLQIVALAAILTAAQCFQLNMTQFYEMPQLYDLDDYDRCMQELDGQTSTYCFVRAQVQPNESVAAWRAIVEISRYDRHHFDHRQLYFGLCLRECEASLAALDDSELESLQAGLLSDNEKVNVYLGLFAMESQNREQHQRLTSACLNWRLKQRGFNLRAKSVVEYCDEAGHVVQDDTWNLTFYGILFGLLVLACVGSLVDLLLKRRRHDKMLKERDHYKTPPKSFVQQLLLTFSVARNWYRLNQEPNGKIGRELRFLDCFKFFSMFMVIFAHTNWVIYESAISNPQDPERLLHTAAGTLLVSGSLITVTFFVISGLLLTINWLAVARTVQAKAESWTFLQYAVLFVKFNVFRYIRLTVPYAFVLLLSGVYFENASGPLWRHIYEREQLACRRNWWTNLLYINNFVRTDERCLLQGWYLAADTQSFVLSLVLLMLGHRFAKWSKQLYAVILAIFMALPVLLTYALDYYPIFVPTPQTQKDSFIGDRQFTEFYTSSLMNFGCYFCGVLAALAYDQLALQQYKLRELRSFQLLWFALIPVGILWLFSAHPIFQHYAAPSAIWGAIYAGLQRNLWAFGLSIFIVGMAGKVGWIFRKFCCLPIFRILGRLTYGAFIIHLLVARIVLATVREPIYFGTGMMFAFIFFTVTVSYLCSFLLAIFLELPVSSLLKLMR